MRSNYTNKTINTQQKGALLPKNSFELLKDC